MSAYSTTFSGEIERVAADLGRAPTPEQTDTLNLILQTLAEIDPEAGTITVEGEAIDAYLAREAGKFALVQAEPEPEPTATDGWVKLTLGTGTGWRKAGDPMTAIMRGLQASDDAALAREIPTWPNPWVPGQVNRTRQVIVTRTDPALAAKFKSEAGTAA